MSILDERIGWKQDHISSLRKEIDESLPWFYSTTFLAVIGSKESPDATEESRIILEEAREKGIFNVDASSYSDNFRSFLFALANFDRTEDRKAFLLRIPTATKLALEQGVFKEDDPDYFIKSMISYL